MKAGALWLLIDHEMGGAQAKNLLLDLGLSKAEITDGVHWVDDPKMLSDAGLLQLLDEMLTHSERTGRELRYVVVDSQTGRCQRLRSQAPATTPM